MLTKKGKAHRVYSCTLCSGVTTLKVLREPSIVPEI